MEFECCFRLAEKIEQGENVQSLCKAIPEYSLATPALLTKNGALRKKFEDTETQKRDNRYSSAVRRFPFFWCFLQLKFKYKRRGIICTLCWILNIQSERGHTLTDTATKEHEDEALSLATAALRIAR